MKKYLAYSFLFMVFNLCTHAMNRSTLERRNILAGELDTLKQKVFRNDFSPRMCNSKCTRNSCDDMKVLALCLAACEWRTIQNCATKTPVQVMLGAAKLAGYETRNLEFSKTLCEEHNQNFPLPYEGEAAVQWWEKNILKGASYQGAQNCRMIWETLENKPLRRD